MKWRNNFRRCGEENFNATFILLHPKVECFSKIILLNHIVIIVPFYFIRSRIFSCSYPRKWSFVEVLGDDMSEYFLCQPSSWTQKSYYLGSEYNYRHTMISISSKVFEITMIFISFCPHSLRYVVDRVTLWIFAWQMVWRYVIWYLISSWTWTWFARVSTPQISVIIFQINRNLGMFECNPNSRKGFDLT